MNTRPVLYIPAVKGLYKECFSSDSDSSMDEYRDHGVDSRNQFTSHLEYDSDDIHVLRKLEHDVDPQTPPMSENAEIENVQCFSAKRKIDFSKKRTANEKNVSSEVSAVEAPSVCQLRSTFSKNNATNERIDSPKILRTIQIHNDDSTGYFTRQRRNTGSTTPISEQKDSSTPELSEKTAVSKSSKKPSQLMREVAVRTTVTGNDNESESRRGRFLRSRTKSETLQKTVQSPSQEFETKEETNHKRRTPRKFHPSSSKTENKSERLASFADEEPVKMKLRRDREMRSSHTPECKSLAVVLPKFDGTNESTPTKRRSTRTVKPVVHLGIESVDDKVESTPVTRSKRVKRFVVADTAPRNVKYQDDDVHKSTPRTRSKALKEQIASYTMDVVDYSDSDTSDDDNYVPSSSDSNEDEDSIDDTNDYVPTSSGSSRVGANSEDEDDDVFYPDRSSLRTKKPQTPKTPRTPRTPRMNVRGLTPSLPPRTNILSTPLTPKDRAMKALHISSVPESLPCRKREYETVYNYLLKKIKGIDGGFVYVYGVPGAGKTATVERVIKRLEMESNAKKIKKFTFIDINGMHLRQPKDAYCQIWKKLEKCSVSATKARCLLERKFQTLFIKQPILLLIDEFDMLFNKTLNVVDTLLDWVDQSKLIVVGIANSKDLIEEIGKSSTKSRMFRERLCDVQFETYTYKQLQEIIEDRLKENEVFTRDAVELLARKSALSGDVRLALNLCRRILAEAGDVDTKNAIDAGKVIGLLGKVYKDPKIELMKSLGTQNQILLRAIRDVILISNLPSCSLARNLYDHYKTLSILDDVGIQNEISLFRNLRLLESYAIVTLSESDCTIHTEISLGNNIDLVQLAFLPERRL